MCERIIFSVVCPALALQKHLLPHAQSLAVLLLPAKLWLYECTIRFGGVGELQSNSQLTSVFVSQHIPDILIKTNKNEKAKLCKNYTAYKSTFIGCEIYD